MKFNIITIGLISAIFLTFSPSVQAEQSASFQLYHETPNYAQRGSADSDSFQMNEDGVTWTAMPLTGSNFQIVTAPPAAALGEEEEEEEAEDEEDEERGGHRGDGPPYPSPPGKEPDKPAAPVEPDKLAPVIPPKEQDFTREPITPGIRYPQADVLFAPPSGFLEMDQYVMAPKRCAPQGGMSPEAWQLLQDSWRQQMFVIIAEGTAGISFLVAFQLVLLKIPQSILLSSHIGSVLFFPIPFWRVRKKVQTTKRKRKKSTSSRKRK